MIQGIIKAVGQVIDKVIPDATKREDIKSEISALLINAEMGYIKQIVELQKQTSGIKWVDTIKHLIRPGICVIMFSRFVASWFGAGSLSKEEWWILQGVIAFYFLSRGAEKIIRKAL